MYANLIRKLARNSFYAVVWNISNSRYFEDVTDKAGVNMDNAWSDLRNAHNSGTHVFGGSFTVSIKKRSNV